MLDSTSPTSPATAISSHQKPIRHFDGSSWKFPVVVMFSLSFVTSASILVACLILQRCPTTEPFACTSLWNTQRFRAAPWILRGQPTDTDGNEDDSVTYLSEEQLRRFWVKSLGLSESTYNEQTTLTKMLLSDEDDDDDDDDDDFEGSTASYVPISSSSLTKASLPPPKKAIPAKAQPKASSSSPSSTSKRLLLRRRTTNTISNSSVSLPLPVPAISEITATMSSTTSSLSATDDAVGVKGSRSVGIDLGTTFSAVSCIEGGRPILIPINGSRIVPSVVAYTKQGQVLVGEAARRQFLTNTDNSYASVKRIIGKTVKEVKASGEKLSSHKIEKTFAAADRGGARKGSGKKKASSGYGGSSDLCRMTCPNVPLGSLGPEDVSAEILKSLVDGASRYLGEPIKRAVVTVPAYFLPSQCEATQRAGERAGLEKVKLLREPEAAALAYGLTQQARQVVLVFDLGGGTFDVSVLEVGGGFVEVIATSGDPHLGGDDFDQVIVDWIVDQYAVTTGDKEGAKELLSHPETLWRLTEAATMAKIALSSEQSVTVNLPLLRGDKGLVNATLKRSRFEALAKPLLVRLLKPLREVAIMAGINLPGESGQLGVRDEAFYATDGETSPRPSPSPGASSDTELASSTSSASASSSVAMSVAELKRQQLGGRASAKEGKRVQGNSLKELRRLQKETMDSNLASFPGGQALDDVLMVGGSTRIPAVQRLVRGVCGVDTRSTAAVHRRGTGTGSGAVINPDEAVSLGAAVMAGILDGDITDMQVVSAWQAAMYRAFYDDYRNNNNGKNNNNNNNKNTIRLVN